MQRIELQQNISRARARLAFMLRRSRTPDGTKPLRFDYVQSTLEPFIRRLREKVAPLEHGKRPLLVGPFDGEVGFELLYWVPLVRWLLREFPRLQGRLVILSRGGVRHWYDGLDARYVDLFSIASPDEVLSRRLSTKQQAVSEFDRELYARARARLGLEETNELHPSLFFGIYYKLLKVDRYAFARSVRRTDRGTSGLFAEYACMEPPRLGVLESELPTDYVAVRFYFRPSFPDGSDTRAFAHSVVESLTRTTDVVLLNTGMELDDHADLADLARRERVHTVDRLMTPETNLEVQTAVIGRSSGFVGTYGGLAYLAPLLGVPSIGFSSLPEHTFHAHLDLAQRIFDGPGWGRILALETAEMPLLALLTDRAAQPRPVGVEAVR